jgi:LysR family transcriptional regulator, nitrogen assimilation regulatory protein
MQLRHLRYFVRIVEAGSFSRAAAAIHVAQPALSHQIAELEEELGVSLLQRSARGVRPTSAGETLYREAAAILLQMDQLPGKVRSTGGVTEGAVNLGMGSTLTSYLAGPFMESCRAALPKVALRFITANSLTIASRIEARTLDLGIVFEDEAVPGFLRRKLFRQRLFLIHREPLPGSLETVSLAELSKAPLVIAAQPNVLREAFDRVMAEANIVPNIVVETDSVFSMLSAVQGGIGHTILPKGDMSDVPGHATISCTPIEPPIYLTSSVLTAGDAPLTGAGEAVRDLFVGFVAHWLAENPLPGCEWVGDAAP